MAAIPQDVRDRLEKQRDRSYVDPQTGERYSRHSVEIVPRLRQLGYTDAHQRADVRKRFSWVNDGRGLTDRQERLWNKAREDKFSKKRDGALSKYLVSLGIRDAAAEYDVGETPK